MTHGIFQRDVSRFQIIPVSFPTSSVQRSDMSYTMRIRYWQENTPSGLQAWAGVKVLSIGSNTLPPGSVNGDPIVNTSGSPFLYIKVYASLFGTVLTAEHKINGSSLRQGVELTCWTYGVAFGADAQWKARHGTNMSNLATVAPAYNIGPFQNAPNNVGYLGTPARTGW